MLNTAKYIEKWVELKGGIHFKLWSDFSLRSHFLFFYLSRKLLDFIFNIEFPYSLLNFLYMLVCVHMYIYIVVSECVCVCVCLCTLA